MILSTIDIGTNTILMVTLARDEGGTVRVLGDEHEIARLGKGVDASRTILPEAFDRVADYLNRYVEIATGLGAERIVAFGTSALRDARNQSEFIAAMHERTGLEITVLSGEDEAELTFKGALSGMNPGEGRYGVLDIGGGSTEIAVGTARQLERATSLEIGAVRITERCLGSLPPSEAGIRQARTFAREIIAGGFALPRPLTMVGVAGTVTTLGAISSGMHRFDSEELNGTHLPAQEIARLTLGLLKLPTEGIAQLPGVHPERADILPGGAIILDEFMKHNDLPELIVSTRGVRFGVALRELELAG
ncbi:MAG TPA: Ppx/GppA phosphatase family protein [Candidatus Kapabacteria bacterium]|nr:Ppx/GppA phosphatase family protein [Candidatus Kapabacteria bacterium]